MLGRPTRGTLISTVALACAFLARGLAFPQQSSQPTFANVAVVAGTAVDDATGSPLEGVLVDLKSDTNRHQTALSDADGHFVISGVTPCRCDVTATLGGFLPSHYGQRAGDTSGTPVVVPAERVTIKLTIRLQRGGVITGRITTPGGRPAVDAVVRAYRREFVPRMGAALMEAAQSASDDRGQYRMWGLAPGEYVVDAASRSSVDAAHGSVRTFAPGTASLADAALVSVRTSEERMGVDVALVYANSVTVSGRLVSSTGDALTDGQVSIVGTGEREFRFLNNTPHTDANKDGRFQFTGIVAGNYSLVASGAVAGVDQWASQPIAVGSTAIQNVSIVLQPGVRVTGEVVFRGSTPVPLGDNPRLWLMPIGRDTVFVRGVQPFSKAIADADGHFRFTFDGVPAGQYWISPFSPTSPWSFHDTSVGGRDYTSAAIDVGTDNVTSATITFTDRAPVLTGTVTVDAGRTAESAVVILFPADRTAWTPWSPMIRTIRPASDGTIEASDLPPGNYRIAAVMEIEPNAWLDAKYLETLVRVATPLTLVEGQRATIALHSVSPK